MAGLPSCFGLFSCVFTTFRFTQPDGRRGEKKSFYNFFLFFAGALGLVIVLTEQLGNIASTRKWLLLCRSKKITRSFVLSERRPNASSQQLSNDPNPHGWKGLLEARRAARGEKRPRALGLGRGGEGGYALMCQTSVGQG